MSVIRLSYKSYKGLAVPIVVIGIKHARHWYPVEAYVDSGATYSIFTKQVAARIGLDYENGSRILVKVGDGRLIPAYLTNLDIQLGGERINMPIGFSERLGVGFNLLGRTGLFNRFKVCFDEGNGLVTFQKHR